MTGPASGLPPGPRSGLAHMVGYFRDPLACHRRLIERYGDPFTVPFLLGHKMVVTGDPQGVQQIFSAPHDSFGVLDKSGAMFMGDRSLILLEGEEHRRMRALLGPAFHPQRQRANAPMFRDVTLRQAARWPRKRPFVLIEHTRRISLEVILRAVFGIRDDDRIRAFEAAVGKLHDKIGFWIVFVPALRRDLGAWSPWRRFVEARRRVDDMVFRQIDWARAQPHGAGDDVLGQLLAAQRDAAPEDRLSDEAIRDQLFTLLMAGHESTATALAWAVYWVLREPRVGERLRAELDRYARSGDVADLDGCAYLEAVCRETLRIHPVAVNVARKLRAPMALRGFELPPGVVVSASIVLAHHDPRNFADPARFDPDRFVDRSYSAAQFLPFGGGRRHCIGAAMGFEEMKVVLATLLTRFRFRLLDTAPLKPVWKEGTMGPKGGVRVTLESEVPFPG